MTAVPHYPPEARARHRCHQEEKGQELFFKTAEREIVVQIGKKILWEKHRTKRKS